MKSKIFQEVMSERDQMVQDVVGKVTPEPEPAKEEPKPIAETVSSSSAQEDSLVPVDKNAHGEKGFNDYVVGPFFERNDREEQGMIKLFIRDGSGEQHQVGYVLNLEKLRPHYIDGGLREDFIDHLSRDIAAQMYNTVIGGLLYPAETRHNRRAEIIKKFISY